METSTIIDLFAEARSREEALEKRVRELEERIAAIDEKAAAATTDHPLGDSDHGTWNGGKSMQNPYFIKDES